jgi:hypothetical protein
MMLKKVSLAVGYTVALWKGLPVMGTPIVTDFDVLAHMFSAACGLSLVVTAAYLLSKLVPTEK